jgi:transketolase
VLHVEDANDLGALRRAFETFAATTDRPTFIIVDSHIGYGAPHKQDSGAAHGEALGEDEVRATKRVYGWPEDAHFLVPDGVQDHFRAGVGARGHALRTAWEARFRDYRAAYPELASELDCLDRRDLPEGWDRDLPTFPADAKGLATRESSGTVLNAIARKMPWLLGGSADLAPSTKTLIADGGDFEAGNHGGRNLHFGVREHAMSAFVNGLALCGLRPYGATFLIFSDYAKPAIRLSALMEIPSIFVFTHDSIGLGEDGPTHQPVEQLISLRTVPGLITIRPADANEVVEAWRVLMPLRDHPVVLVLSRQGLPTIDRSVYASAAGVAQGAYVLADAEGEKPEVLLMATGSEVSLCLTAYEQLKSDGIRTRVVSMPSWELFEQQDQAYRDEVLPPSVTARVSVEQASTVGWDRYVGPHGTAIGMRTFGASGPYKDVQQHFGFTPGHIVAAARDLVARARA